MLRWCEAHGVHYIVGIAKNSRLHQKAEASLERVAQGYQSTGEKQRLFGSVRYGAHTWDRERRVMVKAEHTARGSNPRFVVTNLPGTNDYLYDRVYCARGDMENRLKDPPLDLFADRASCHRFWPQPVPAVVVGFGLYLAADRGGGAAQYPPHTDPTEQHLPAPGAVPYGRRSPPGHFLTIAECCPGTLTNNGGKGGGVSAVRKNRAGTMDHGQNTDVGTLITAPNRKTYPSRTTHAIFGLAIILTGYRLHRPLRANFNISNYCLRARRSLATLV